MYSAVNISCHISTHIPKHICKADGCCLRYIHLKKNLSLNILRPHENTKSLTIFTLCGFLSQISVFSSSGKNESHCRCYRMKSRLLNIHVTKEHYKMRASHRILAQDITLMEWLRYFLKQINDTFINLFPRRL